MLFKNLFHIFKRPPAQSLVAIYIAQSAGCPMQSISEVEALLDKGLSGDRYATKTGYWDPVEGCQVTLISEDDLKRASKATDLAFDNGQHRRNLLVSGIKTKALEGRQFQIGEVVFCYEKPRPPCGYLNKIQGRGMALALSYNSGICIRVVKGGKLRVGDSLKILGVHES